MGCEPGGESGETDVFVNATHSMFAWVAPVCAYIVGSAIYIHNHTHTRAFMYRICAARVRTIELLQAHMQLQK